MGRYARKKQHKGDKPMKSKYRVRRRTKDLDEIHADMQPENSSKLLRQDVDYDVAGNAQHYCLHCSWVINQCYFPSLGTEIKVWKTLFSVR